MRIKIFSLLIICCCVSTFFIDSTAAQQYQVKDSFARLIPLPNTFSKIIVSDGISLIYNQSEEAALAVSGRSEAFINNLDVAVVGDTLKVELKNSLRKGNLKPEYRVYASSSKCDYIFAKDAARVIILGDLTSDSLMITASGASKINADLKVGFLMVNLSEASFAEIKGEVKTAKIYVNEASKLMASALKIKEANINAKAASKLWLLVQDKCEIYAEGASIIYLQGEPVIKERRLNGFSKLINTN